MASQISLLKKGNRFINLTGKFNQTFRGQIIPILAKQFQTVGKREKLPNSFYEVNICKKNSIF